MLLLTHYKITDCLNHQKEFNLLGLSKKFLYFSKHVLITKRTNLSAGSLSIILLSTSPILGQVA